jgi:hypothetical protein
MWPSELEIPDVHRGEPDATKDLPRLDAFRSTKAEDLLGLKQTRQLKDMVEDSVEDFRARGYPGFIRPESSTRKVTIKVM